MNKYSIIEKIEKALEAANITCEGAICIDIPFDMEPENIFVYDMSYSTFKRDLVAVYNVSTDKAIKPWF